MLPTGRCWGGSIISEFIARLEGGPNCCVYPTPAPVLPPGGFPGQHGQLRPQEGKQVGWRSRWVPPAGTPSLPLEWGVGDWGTCILTHGCQQDPGAQQGSVGWGLGHPEPREAEGHLVNWEERPLGSRRAGGTGPGGACQARLLGPKCTSAWPEPPRTHLSGKPVSCLWSSDSSAS